MNEIINQEEIDALLSALNPGEIKVDQNTEYIDRLKSIGNLIDELTNKNCLSSNVFEHLLKAKIEILTAKDILEGISERDVEIRNKFLSQLFSK